MNKNGMTREEIKQAKSKFAVRQYGVHSQEVVSRDLEFATMLKKTDDLEKLKNLVQSYPSLYNGHLGLMLKAWANGKDPQLAIQEELLRQDAKSGGAK